MNNTQINISLLNTEDLYVNDSLFWKGNVYYHQDEPLDIDKVMSTEVSFYEKDTSYVQNHSVQDEKVEFQVARTPQSELFDTFFYEYFKNILPNCFLLTTEHRAQPQNRLRTYKGNKLPSEI